ncbi:MAG TPA: hypothetical protein VE442_13525 [Jatrophihabitans sp.]|jgi:hypothetical protein|nr:hypothetical protein [Jatrophihabitans sp.]
MRSVHRITAAVGFAALAAAVAVNADAASPAGSPLQGTVKVVVRPVTTAGHPSTGFSVTGEPAGQVDCSFKEPSPGAVSSNIEFCSPSFEYAIACWKAAAPHRVLCLRDPRSQRVWRIPRHGAFASTHLAPRAQRAPLEIRLGDGHLCFIRDGAAGGMLPGHPNLFGTYTCAHDGEVWASENAKHNGVNESHPTWTVRTAHGGSHTLLTRRVAKAWFAGTAQA